MMAGILIWLTVSGQLGRNYAIWSAGSELRSSADTACAPLWVINARNDPAIHCYLTTDISRLCKPSERVHLAKTFRSYHREANRYVANVLVRMFGPLIFPSVTASQVGAAQEEARVSIMGEPAGKNYKPGAMRDLAETRMKDLERFNVDGLDQALAVQRLPDEEIIAAVKKIAESGLMSQDDFGWFADTFIDDAFGKVKRVTPICGD
jgi:hypothetical protein